MYSIIKTNEWYTDREIAEQLASTGRRVTSVSRTGFQAADVTMADGSVERIIDGSRLYHVGAAIVAGCVAPQIERVASQML